MYLKVNHSPQAFKHKIFAEIKRDIKHESLYLAFTLMINKNYIKADKIVLARWVDTTLDQTFSSKNSIVCQLLLIIVPLFLFSIFILG
jgi:hypothetical protein